MIYIHITPENYERAAENNIPAHVLERRMRKQFWHAERATTEPVRKITHRDKKWVRTAIKNGIPYATFDYRVRRGWTEEAAATTPVMTPKEASTFGNASRSLLTEEQRAIAEANGLSKEVIRYRIKTLKMSITKAITTPLMKNHRGARLAYKPKRRLMK